MQPGTSNTASSVSLVRRLLFKFGIKDYFRKIDVTAIAEVLPAVLLKIPFFRIVRRISSRRIQRFLDYWPWGKGSTIVWNICNFSQFDLVWRTSRLES